MEIQTSYERDNDRLASFKAVTERFAQLAKRENLDIIPYRGSEPVCFPALPTVLQTTILEDFRRYVSVCETSVEEGWSLKQDGNVLWRMFRKLGVHPNSDLMSQIREDDIIEIYSADYVQLFRNLRFFRYCGYSLDELLSRPFWELFRRDEEVTKQILSVAVSMFSGQIIGTHRWQLGVHTLTEIDSHFRYESTIEPGLVSPLCDTSGRIVALVNTARCLSCVPGAKESPKAL